MAIVDQIAEEGWASYPDFLAPKVVQRLKSEFDELYNKGAFRQAGIGKGANFQVKPEIRSDHVYWLDPDNLTSLQNEYWRRIDQLRRLFNQEFYLGLKSFEAHLAKYPPGSFYKRHIDQFQQVSYRIISCILYLNADWRQGDGGELRIFLPDGKGGEKYIDIVPKAGTLVCFKSDEIPHEVLPTNKERYSFTGWMRNIE